MDPEPHPPLRRYGRLTVLSLAERRGTHYFDLARCDCGTVKVVNRTDLQSGRTLSCGCLRRERVGQAARKHGLKHHPMYGSWQTMINRCHNPSATAYPWYGAMGVTVCDRWRDSFAAFLADVGERPVGQTLDLIDPTLGYEPGNTRWASKATQARNTRKRWMAAQSEAARQETFAPIFGVPHV